jgi:16S rRNA processing protein RimM
MTLEQEPQRSNSRSSPQYLAVGKLRRPHGLKGEILMDILTDFPERLVEGVVLYAGEERLPLRVKGNRPNDKSMLISFEGYDTSESVGVLRNQTVFVLASDRPALQEGEYYHHELLGLRVVDENGQLLGRVTGILDTGGANDVYLVSTQSRQELLLPDIEEVVLKIDLEAGEMRVHILPGLLPDE